MQEEETVVEPDQGNGELGAFASWQPKSLPAKKQMLTFDTASTCSAVSHYIPTAARGRPEQGSITNVYLGAQVDAGADHEVR